MPVAPETIRHRLAELLELSGAVSPWLYMLLGVFILSKTVTRIWGHKSQS